MQCFEGFEITIYTRSIQSSGKSENKIHAMFDHDFSHLCYSVPEMFFEVTLTLGCWKNNTV
jgi:hypothetical protein